MEATSLFWSIPSEIVIDILALVPFRSVLNFETASKTQLHQFNERDLYKNLSCKLFHWGPNDVKAAEQDESEKINWKAEFIISSIHHAKILTNELQFSDAVDPKIRKSMAQMSPNHYRYIQPIAFPAREAPNVEMFGFQSKIPLYPHPIADFTVAYYETSLLAKRSPEVEYRFGVGAALDGYQAFVGLGRNSFAYCNKGQILMEFDIAPKDHPVFNANDTVGFGIDFKKRAVFWTLNGQLVCTKTHNYWQERLLNLETLHAVVSCHQGYEFSVNFGASPFMFDILKYQLQQESEEKAKKDKLDPMFAFASSTSSAKQTYSITMFRTMLRYIEEDTIDAIDRGVMSPWSVCDCNQPNEAPKTYIPSLWALLTYPQGDFVHLRMFETLAMRWELLKEWKDDKDLQTNLKQFVHAANMPFNEAKESFEDLIIKLQTNASRAVTMMTDSMLDMLDQQIRNDIGVYLEIAPGWTQIAKAFKFLVPTNLPLEHYLIQAIFYYVGFYFNLGVSLPIKQEMIPDLMMLCQEFIISFRLFAIKLIILDKNEQKKEEFEKRNAWLQELYRERISEKLLEAMMANSVVPTTPTPVTENNRETIQEGMQATNLIRLEHYNTLSDISKSCTILEVMCMARLSDAHLESEEVLVKEAKKQIRRMMNKEKYIEGLERLKIGLQAAPSGVVDIAMLFGLDVNVGDAKLLELVTRSIEETIDNVKNEKKKKKKKRKKTDQITFTNQLLIGAGLGLLVGLGAAFFMHRYKSK